MGFKFKKGDIFTVTVDFHTGTFTKGKLYVFQEYSPCGYYVRTMKDEKGRINGVPKHQAIPAIETIIKDILAENP